MMQVLEENKVIELLSSSVKNKKIAHAYVFLTGQWESAELAVKYLAKSCLCEKGYGVACGTCNSCYQIESNIHPDVRVITPEGLTLKISQIRNIRTDSQISSYGGKQKFYIIKNAEALNEESSNALLKILEEPSSSSMFILVTSQMQKLLPTILSRCQIVRFKNSGLKHFNGSLKEQDEWVSLAELSNLDDINKLFTGIKNIAKENERDQILNFLDFLLEFYRNIYASYSLNPDPKELQKTRFSFKVLPSVMENIEKAKQHINKNANVELTLEVLFIELAQLRLGTK